MSNIINFRGLSEQILSTDIES